MMLLLVFFLCLCRVFRSLGFEDGQAQLSRRRVPVEGGRVAGEGAHHHPPCLDPQRLQPGVRCCVAIGVVSRFTLSGSIESLVFFRSISATQMVLLHIHGCVFVRCVILVGSWKGGGSDVTIVASVAVLGQRCWLQLLGLSADVAENTLYKVHLIFASIYTIYANRHA